MTKKRKSAAAAAAWHKQYEAERAAERKAALMTDRAPAMYALLEQAVAGSDIREQAIALLQEIEEAGK